MNTNDCIIRLTSSRARALALPSPASPVPERPRTTPPNRIGRGREVQGSGGFLPRKGRGAAAADACRAGRANACSPPEVLIWGAAPQAQSGAAAARLCGGGEARGATFWIAKKGGLFAKSFCVGEASRYLCTRSASHGQNDTANQGGAIQNRDAPRQARPALP